MSVLALADAKTHLNLTGTTNDTELQGVIDAAEAMIGQRVGPLLPTPVTVRVHGCGARVLVLPVRPVLSLVSVTAVLGGAITVGSLYLDPWAGTVSYPNEFWYFPAPSYDVVYQAGRASVPADLMFAVKELVRHLWRSQRGSGVKRPGAGQPADGAPAPGYLIPYAVASLLEPHEPLGIA